MSLTGSVGGGSTQMPVSTGTTQGAQTQAGTGGHQSGVEDAGEKLEEHEREWTTQDQAMNQNPALFASTYGSGAGTGVESGLGGSGEPSGSTHTGGSAGA